eukprot:scaffold198328_cov37-Tisochrysis_lutea.AAC.3
MTEGVHRRGGRGTRTVEQPAERRCFVVDFLIGHLIGVRAPRLAISSVLGTFECSRDCLPATDD